MLHLQTVCGDAILSHRVLQNSICINTDECLCNTQQWPMYNQSLRGHIFVVKICSAWGISPRSAILLMSWCSPHLITYFKMSCSLACEREGGKTARHSTGILPYSYFTKMSWRICEFNDRLEQRHHFSSHRGSSINQMSGTVTYSEYLKTADVFARTYLVVF